MKQYRSNKISSLAPRLVAVSFIVILSLLILDMPPRLVSAAGFADRAFQQIWERTDAPVLSGQAQRSWYWGPQPGNTMHEPYSGVQGGMRLVQYFDKARMEINNPNGDRSSEWFVTTGLLVVDMVSGKQQVGNKEFVPKRAAEIAVGGDGLSADPQAPTYTSFRAVSAVPGSAAGRAPNLIGRSVTTTINRAGQLGDNPALGAYSGVKLATYNDVFGHNIPQAMWDFLNLKGVVQENGKLVSEQTLANWVFVMGYPISEPFWARVKINGIYYDVLFQLYQRRSLAYIPAFQKGWQVQMGNVGQHYYQWLYGGPLPTPLVPTATPVPPPPPTSSTPARANPTATTQRTPLPPSATRTRTAVPIRGSATAVPTAPVVPTQPAGGLVLSVRPGAGPPDAQFTFSASGLTPGEPVQVKFTDPNGSVVYPANSNGGRYMAGGDGRLSIALVPGEAFTDPPAGSWLFELRGERSGLEGVIGFVLR